MLPYLIFIGSSEFFSEPVDWVRQINNFVRAVKFAYQVFFRSQLDQNKQVIKECQKVMQLDSIPFQAYICYCNLNYWQRLILNLIFFLNSNVSMQTRYSQFTKRLQLFKNLPLNMQFIEIPQRIDEATSYLRQSSVKVNLEHESCLTGFVLNAIIIVVSGSQSFMRRGHYYAFVIDIGATPQISVIRESSSY